MTHSLVENDPATPASRRGAPGLIEECTHPRSPLHTIALSQWAAQRYPHSFYGDETAEHAIASAQRVLAFVFEFFAARGEVEITGRKNR